MPFADEVTSSIQHTSSDQTALPRFTETPTPAYISVSRQQRQLTSLSPYARPQVRAVSQGHSSRRPSSLRSAESPFAISRPPAKATARTRSSSPVYDVGDHQGLSESNSDIYPASAGQRTANASRQRSAPSDFDLPASKRSRSSRDGQDLPYSPRLPGSSSGPQEEPLMGRFCQSGSLEDPEATRRQPSSRPTSVRPAASRPSSARPIEALAGPSRIPDLSIAAGQSLHDQLQLSQGEVRNAVVRAAAALKGRGCPVCTLLGEPVGSHTAFSCPRFQVVQKQYKAIISEVRNYSKNGLKITALGNCMSCFVPRDGTTETVSHKTKGVVDEKGRVLADRQCELSDTILECSTCLLVLPQFADFRRSVGEPTRNAGDTRDMLDVLFAAVRTESCCFRSSKGLKTPDGVWVCQDIIAKWHASVSHSAPSLPPQPPRAIQPRMRGAMNSRE
jgi:hypothetical protein